MTRLLPLAALLPLLACSKHAPSDDTDVGDDTDATSDSGDTDVTVLPCDAVTSGAWSVVMVDAHGEYEHDWTLDVACDGDTLASVTQEEGGGEPIVLTPADGGLAGGYDEDWDEPTFSATIRYDVTATFATPGSFTGTWTDTYTYVSGDLSAFQSATYADGEVGYETYDLTGTLAP